MPLIIPNTFQGQSPSPVSRLDQDLALIATYYNARSPVFGLLANRPAAGNAGAIYVATDVAGGTPYLDNGAAWVQMAGAVTSSPVGMYGSRGLVANNNAGTPNTKVDITADLVQLWSPSDFGVSVVKSPGTITCDVGAAGPVINGRDQAAAFGVSNWIHFYLIYNGATVASLASLTAPPIGPVLPATYTKLTYVGPFRFDGSSHLVPMYLMGSMARYRAKQSALSGGVSAGEATVSLSTLVPPTALLSGVFYTARSGTTGSTATIRLVTGVDWIVLREGETGGTLQGNAQAEIFAPNLSQQIFYLVAGATLDLDIMGYVVANGG